MNPAGKWKKKETKQKIKNWTRCDSSGAALQACLHFPSPFKTVASARERLPRRRRPVARSRLQPDAPHSAPAKTTDAQMSSQPLGSAQNFRLDKEKKTKENAQRKHFLKPGVAVPCFICSLR